MKHLPIFITLLISSFCLADVKPSELVEKTKPSLVIVQFTYDGEIGRREVAGMGIVLREDGLTMFSIDLTPRGLPDEQMKDFKIIIPGDEETEYEAFFLGRDERFNISYVKPKKEDLKLTPLKFADQDVQIGDKVMSVGLLPKSAGYGPYLTTAEVSAKLRGPIPQVLVSSGGMGVIGSPVFNANGQAIGLINTQTQRTPLLNDPSGSIMTVEVPTRYYVPAKDFIKGFENTPDVDKPVKYPFMGVNQLTGLSKDVAEFYGLKGQVAIQVGDVVPGMPAEKAGLKKSDIIVKLDGQPLERGDEPEEAPLIFTRKLSQKNVGDKVVLTILTEKDKTHEVPVTLEERPMMPNKAKRYYAEDLGFTARDIVFDDIYTRRLGKDSKGLVITFIRPQSASQAAQLQMNDMITLLNQTPVTDVEQFKTDYKKFREEKPREAVVLEVLRQGNTQIIRIEPPRE